MNTFAVEINIMDVKLSEISAGKTVVIKSFEKDDIFLKLMEMGCVPGEKIIVDQIAPLGDPISILVAGYHLSLRINEAENIWVEEIAK
jgi:ferrous iron transport protein A